VKAFPKSRKSSNHSLKNNMDKIKICADFNNADSSGRLRLNCQGTVDDLQKNNIQLWEGLTFIFADDELEADGIVTYSETEKIWVATIDWEKLKEL